MRADEAAGRRDQLLAVAREAVEAGYLDATDAATLAAGIHGAWAEVADDDVAAEPAFTLDPRTGVEAMAFLVGTPGEGEPQRAGLILRLPGELPDSFEPLDLDGPGPFGLHEVHHTFFRTRRSDG